MTEKQENPQKEVFYSKGLHFECQRCSFCCGHSPGFVYLSLRDLKALCLAKKMTVKAFVEEYCRWADWYTGSQVLALKEQKNYDCILWNKGCSCYEARPVQCSTWPFWSWMVETKESWEECAKECPGMNKGRLWSFEEIESNRLAYEKNTPLHREEVFKLIEDEEKKPQKKN